MRMAKRFGLWSVPVESGQVSMTEGRRLCLVVSPSTRRAEKELSERMLGRRGSLS